jgi:hypothetical protein
MKSLALIDKKDEGHKLIDELVWVWGMPRMKVYRKLKKRLKREDGREHFAQMNTIGECNEAIKHLKIMIANQGLKREAAKLTKAERVKMSTKGSRKGICLPHDDMQRAFAELRARRAQPQTVARETWWRRITHHLPKFSLWAPKSDVV